MSQPAHGPDLPPPAPPLPDTSSLVGCGRETLCAHWGDDPSAQRGAAAVPIYQASTFVFPDAESFERRDEPGSPYYTYTRVGNPTTAVLQAKIAQLENGTWCYAVASGMGAISAALNACTAAGSHVVCTERCYWPAARYLRSYLPRFGVETTFVNSVQVEDYVEAFRPETRVLYIESPTSGTFDVLDVQRLASAARDRGIYTLIDNSWASPMHFNPLDHGVDLVLHSGTKYIGGHSDALAGFVIGRDLRLQRLMFREVELMGGTIDPFAAWLMLRGLRTLPLRIERHAQTALACAEFLQSHPKVRRVRHPALETHPHHAVARRQFRGWGSLFSFELADPSKEAAYRFVDALRLFAIGVSWGGYESLALAGHFGDPREGVWMVRLHCGLETEADLLADIARALETV